MKTIIVFILNIAILFVVAGCSRQQEISGEVFTAHTKERIIKYPGTVVYFLNLDQYQQFENLLQEKRNKKYEEDRVLGDNLAKEYREIFNKYKRDDNKVYEIDAGEETFKRIKSLEFSIKQADSRIEKKAYNREIFLEDEEVKSFLASVHHTTVGSEGNFKVVLSLGKECWVLAKAESYPYHEWYFRYVPDGTPLVLSNGNKW